ncbi:rhomboid family intramembrane serine protease [Rugosimonospora acidiphila]|uniref:Rhomboid family intramembrane serine protease n=1 Tax=Rugosimonospora acidiphila TaxID=556531 RepID=A0ABP9RR25_9ACTN
MSLNPPVPDPESDPNSFGTVAFYAALGKAFVAMCGVVVGLFLIEVLNHADGNRLNALGGIHPHSLDGIDGIVFAPFLHASFAHFYSNAVPLLLTGTFALAIGVKRFLGVTVLIALVSGLGVWFIGSPNTRVVGASGVILGYIGFLLVRGIVERSWWGIAVGLLIGLLYGTQIFGDITPTNEQVSWQAHLFGLIGGVIAAILFRRRRPRPVTPREPEPLVNPTLDLPSLD